MGTFLLIAALVGFVSSTVFLGLAIAGAVRFRWQGRGSAARPSLASLPPVSLLKPLHGMEPRLRENLESFFRQDYPQFEIVFGARNPADPAMAVVAELQQKYPGVSVKTVFSGEPKYPNAKIHAVEQIAASASYPYLILSDSDVEVGPGYIRAIAAPLQDPAVGLVTCLYRGRPAGGLWSRLEALGMSVDMSSGVLIADMLEGMKFALGPTMAFRRDSLQKMGGLASLGEYCADDYLLGNRIAACGYQVVLSHYLVDHIVMNCSFRESLLHQARWMKSTRFSRPKGHIGTGMTFAMPFGVLGLVAGALTGRWELGLLLLGLAFANRVLQAVTVGWGVVRDPRALAFCWLYPFRDLLGFTLWAASFTSREIVWRGQRFRLEAQGKMTHVGRPVAGSSTPVAVDRLA